MKELYLAEEAVGLVKALDWNVTHIFTVKSQKNR